MKRAVQHHNHRVGSDAYIRYTGGEGTRNNAKPSTSYEQNTVALQVHSHSIGSRLVVRADGMSMIYVCKGPLVHRVCVFSATIVTVIIASIPARRCLTSDVILSD